MISAFAKGAQMLDEPRYGDAARGAANFIRRFLWDDARGVLLRRFREGEAAIDGFLDDYAFLINALLDLYESEFKSPDLAFAIRLAERAIEVFEDCEHGGFFSAGDSADLVLRLKDDYDGAEPSGNSGMALALLRLARMTDRDDFRGAAERTLKVFGSRLKSAERGTCPRCWWRRFALARPREIVLAGPDKDSDMPAMLAAIRRRFLPNTVVLMANETGRSMPAIDNRATAYVCENYACKLPVTSVAELEEQLGRPATMSVWKDQEQRHLEAAP